MICSLMFKAIGSSFTNILYEYHQLLYVGMNSLWTDAYERYSSTFLLKMSILIGIIGGIIRNFDFAGNKHEVDWNGGTILVFFYIGLFFSYD